MSRLRPSIPPDVAHALQRQEGSVSVRYSLPRTLAGPPEFDTPLMETPNEEVLAALTLDTRLNLKWDPGQMSVTARDQHDPDGRLLEGGWPSSSSSRRKATQTPPMRSSRSRPSASPADPIRDVQVLAPIYRGATTTPPD